MIMTVETTTDEAATTVEKAVVTATICPKCGREYSAPPAISRTDNETKICPVCGIAEALEAASIPEDERERILAEAEKAEIEHGRVNPRVA